MKTSTQRWGVVSTALSFAIWNGCATAEQVSESDVDTRLNLAFHAEDARLEQYLPPPWKASAFPGGPIKGANLVLVLVEKLLAQGPDGKPLAVGGTERAVAVVVPAKKVDSEELRLFVIKSYTNDRQGLPGPYKNAALVSMRRHFELKQEAESLGTASDFWEMKDPSGATMYVRVAYQRTVPSRAKFEMRPYSAADPNFFRIYRGEQGVELLKSAPANVNRISQFEFHPGLPELEALLGKSPELVGITSNPWYIRQVSLP